MSLHCIQKHISHLQYCHQADHSRRSPSSEDLLGDGHDNLRKSLWYDTTILYGIKHITESNKFLTFQQIKFHIYRSIPIYQIQNFTSFLITFNTYLLRSRSSLHEILVFDISISLFPFYNIVIVECIYRSYE